MQVLFRIIDLIRRDKKGMVLFFFCVATVSAGVSEPVEPKMKSLAFSLGYSHMRMLDAQVSPLIYKSHLIPIQIDYSSKTTTRILRFSLNLAGGILQSTDFKRRQFILSNMNDDDGNTKSQVITIENLPIIQDELNIQYLRQIQSKVSTHSEWYVGGILKEYFSLSMGAIVFVHSEVSFNPSVFYCFTLNEKSNIFSSLSLPVIGIITRLPYSNDPADGKNGPFVSSYTLGTKFATLNKYQRVNFDLAYKYILNNKWSIAANYRFYWFHYSVNREIAAYDNAFHLQFDRKLQLRQKKSPEGVGK